jgi:hypothetical protein
MPGGASEFQFQRRQFMNANQFTLMTYQWVFDKILPSIAPATWQRQVLAFAKGDEIFQKITIFASNLSADEQGNIDISDLEKRFEAMLKIDPVFAYPINDPKLCIIGIGPEHVLRFKKEDMDSFLAHLKGSTTTTQVTL